MGRLFLFLFVCIGMFGCMAANLSTIGSGPDGGVVRHVEAPDSSVAADTAAADGATPSGETAAYLGNGLVLDRRDDGHFYAKVEINGSTIDMLVDTGASGIALSENDARRVGIATSIGMRDHIGEGAGGAVYGDVVQIDRIRLGDVEVDNVTGVVLKGGNMSLLGQSFLSKFGKVEIAGDRMILRS